MNENINPEAGATPREQEIDRIAMQIFDLSLEILGGPRRLFAYKNLTWLPSLMEAVYVVLYAEELMKTSKEIAQELGLSSQTVRNILAADPEAVKKKLFEELQQEATPVKTHTAGGLAKLAYRAWKERGGEVAAELSAVTGAVTTAASLSAAGALEAEVPEKQKEAARQLEASVSSEIQETPKATMPVVEAQATRPPGEVIAQEEIEKPVPTELPEEAAEEKVAQVSASPAIERFATGEEERASAESGQLPSSSAQPGTEDAQAITEPEKEEERAVAEVISTPPTESPLQEIDRIALRVFHKTLDLLGGPRKLFEYKNLTWLPSLMEAAYVVVYAEELLKTSKEIAQELGLSTQTVRNILAADPELVKKKLEQVGEEEGQTIKTHTAGGLAKLAYRALKEAGEIWSLTS